MGTLVLAPLIEHMIHTVGWRHALLILPGAILCLLVPVTAVFQRRSPASIGQFPDGRDPETAQKHMPELKRHSPNVKSKNYRRHQTLKASLQSKAFWCIALVVFCNGFLINMLVVHSVAHMVDLGYSPYLAATMLGIVGIMGSMGGILCGFLSDRLGREIGLTLGGCAAFTGVLILMLVREAASPWMLYAYATFYGLGQGAMGPMTATATGDLFPEHYLGRLLAIQSIGFGFGGALGAYAGGHFYDQTGSYFTAFLLVLISIGVGVVGIWIAAPRRRIAF
jgi:predicted MFS family arabinose efflux permease